MKRTQLYLHKDMWKALHAHARQRGRSISDLVREAIREKYGSSPTRRRQAMQALVGLWKNRKDFPPAPPTCAGFAGVIGCGESLLEIRLG